MDAWRSPDWVRLKYFRKINSVSLNQPFIVNVNEKQDQIDFVEKESLSLSLDPILPSWIADIVTQAISIWNQRSDHMCYKRITEKSGTGSEVYLCILYPPSPYIFCEGVPSLHSHTSGLSWSGPNYHSSNGPALPSPPLPAIEHPPFFASTSCEILEKEQISSQSFGSTKLWQEISGYVARIP